MTGRKKKRKERKQGRDNKICRENENQKKNNRR